MIKSIISVDGICGRSLDRSMGEGLWDSTGSACVVGDVLSGQVAIKR